MGYCLDTIRNPIVVCDTDSKSVSHDRILLTSFESEKVMTKFVNGDRVLVHSMGDDDPLNGLTVTVIGFLGRWINRTQDYYIVVLDSPNIIDGWTAGAVSEKCLSKL